jgi:hypothetical protein
MLIQWRVGNEAAMATKSDNLVALNADMERVVVIDTSDIAWQSSPSPTVWRKRLHLFGETESAQVTSIVRYDPGSNFPAHDHPDGEEILVLDGVFSDEHGDWGAGSHLLNPEGFRHAPFSRDGCVIFVKLQQYAGRRRHQSLQTASLPWAPTGESGVARRQLYVQDGFPERIVLEQWEPGTVVRRECPDGIEILVVKGELSVNDTRCSEGTWLRLPCASVLRARSDDGCVLYCQTGAIPKLRSRRERGEKS